jgi:CubicO group peptidase (beta-lactamase class C family)
MMQHAQPTVEVAERIRRVENSLAPEPAVWNEEAPPATLAARMAYHATPGLSVAVIDDGEIAWARGYGVIEAGSAEPVTADTIFQCCSISKHVAMVGTLRLVQEGVLDLDEDANHYLVEWKLPPNGAWQPRVTVRHLLGHTAGLSYNWYRGFRRGEPTPTLLQVLQGQPTANTPPVRCVMFPGSQFRYSGSHYSVLQQLLVDVTKQQFPELMQALVFAPLGMRNSSYDQAYPDARPDSTAVGHYIGGEPVYGKWRVIPEMAGAGLWTTATDLALLAREIQRAHTGKPTAFLSKAVADQALTPQIDDGFGLGADLEGADGSRRFGHSGGNVGYTCRSQAYLEHGIGAVALTNAEDGYWVVLELLRAIAREYAWPDYLPQRNTSTVDPQIYDGYVGEYEPRPGFSLKIRREGDGLYVEAPGQPRMRLHPSAETAFFADALNSEINFTKDDAGAVTGLSLKQEGQETQAKKVG